MLVFTFLFQNSTINELLLTAIANTGILAWSSRAQAQLINSSGIGTTQNSAIINQNIVQSLVGPYKAAQPMRRMLVIIAAAPRATLSTLQSQ